MRSFWLTILLICSSVRGLAQPPQHPKLPGARADFRAAAQRRDTLAMAEAAYIIGKHTWTSNDYVGGRNWLLYALRIWEKRGPSVQLNKVLIQLSGDESVMGNFPEAFVYANRALANSRQLKHPHSLMSAYWMLGTLHLERAQNGLDTPTARKKTGLDSAARYLQQAEAIALKIGKTIDIAGIRNTWAELLLDSDPAKAVDLLEYALRAYLTSGQGVSITRLHYKLSTAFLAVNNRRKAYEYLEKADSLLRQINDANLRLIIDGHYAWVKWYEATRQWPQAYQRLRMADSLQKRQLTREQRAVIAQLNVGYETSRRDKLLQQREAELKINKAVLTAQQNYTYGALGFSAVVLLASAFFYRLWQQNKRTRQQNEQLLAEQSHRTKNHLQAISGLLSLQASQLTDEDAKRAVEESQIRIQSMTLLNRKLSQATGQHAQGLPDIVPEIVQMILRSYSPKAVAVTCQVEPVPISVEQILPVVLILNELVTNACKYAFPNHPHPSLTIRCWPENNRIRLRVQDNGPGIRPDTSRKGFGMRLIALQTEQLWAEASFSQPPGLTFDLSIPGNA
ncbi:sensor histidine kinase [Rudanella lutea]|uniref:sensor histidine kinase n=1 Tax=Rudanella lutea TaxID=451374 RepID=UPI00036B1335|nr:sensor histidine kinase [Rudanella lutea]